MIIVSKPGRQTRTTKEVYDEMFKDLKVGDEIKVVGIKEGHKIKRAVGEFIKRNKKDFISVRKSNGRHFNILIKDKN